MNITSTANSQSILQTNQTHKNERANETNSSMETTKHTVQALDDRANKILDKLIEGKGSREETYMKFSLDWRLNMRRDESGKPIPDENGFFLIDNSIGNSKEDIVKKIDFAISDLEQPGQTDILGILDVLKNLKSLYLNNYSPLDTKA